MTTAAELEAVAEVCGRQNYNYCATPADLELRLRTEPPPEAIVWGIDPAHEHAISSAVATSRAVSSRIPHLFRVELGSEGSRMLCRLAVRSRGVTLYSLRGYDDLKPDLELLRVLPEHAAAQQDVLARIGICLDGDGSGFVRNVTVAAVLLSRRRTQVARLAEAVGVSVKELRARTRREGGLEPALLLRWTQVLYCLRQAELSRPLKTIAAEGGYSRPEALTNKMARISGMRLRASLNNGGFYSVLEDFERLLKARKVAARSVSTRIEAPRSPEQLGTL